MTDFLFIDVETTGLDIAHQPLEVFIQRLDPADGGHIGPEADGLRVLVKPGPMCPWGEWAQKAHLASGLAAEAYAEGMPPIAADRKLRAYVQDEGMTDVVLVGSSVHFDARVVRQWFPRFADTLSHRILDITSVGYLMQLARVPVADPARRGKHTARADIEDSAAALAAYVDAVRAR